MSGRSNFSWEMVSPDYLETYDRQVSAYEPDVLEWVTDQMSGGSPSFSGSQFDSSFETFMREPPGATESYDDWERKERLNFAIALELERLPDEDAWIMYMLFWVRLSLRFVARVLEVPKTSMARRRDEILTRLRKSMIEYPVVQQTISNAPITPFVIPAGMPPLSSVATWEAGAEWSWDAMTKLADPAGHSVESLLKQGREAFPKEVTLGWWTDLLKAALTESDGIVQRGPLMALLSSKQHDYGYDNIAAFGHLGILIRCSDKAARLDNLKGKDAPVNESVTDTYYDLCGYAIIAGMLEWGLFMLPQRFTPRQGRP